MPIVYRMEENNLKPGTFYARVIRGETAGLDRLLAGVSAKTSLKLPELKVALAALVEGVAAALSAGEVAVIDGLASFRTSLSGSFEERDYQMARENARLNVVAQVDRQLGEAVAARATYSRQETEVKVPVVNSFYDVATDAYDLYTPGSIVRLEGRNLKFEPNQADEGVFIHNGTAEIRLAVYSVAGGRQIDTLIPPEGHGTLTVTVRARYSEGGELRQGVYHRRVRQA